MLGKYGNMTQYGDWTYTYDSMNRLVTVSSNGVLLVTNSYDVQSRRVRKVTSEATTTFFYDDWNLVEERIAYTNGTTSTIHYYWGKDLSGTLQGAGGVGGLLYLMVDGAVYIPCYDNNGNITHYLDASGSVVAEYTYDAFGHTISQSGMYASFFRYRFSTKYFNIETDFYYYGYRFYSAILRCWLTRDPIGECDGGNIYAYCRNMPTCSIDVLGLKRWIMFYFEKPGETSFKRAAETLKRGIESKSTFRSGCDKVIMKSVTTAEGFVSKWNSAKGETDGADPNLKVVAAHLFTHSGRSKLYFYGESTTSKDISKLPKLNWSDGGSVICHGCNSGLQSWDDVSVAESFANGQGVTAEGQTGYSQFSTSPNKRSIFTRVSDSSGSVYLWSYGDGGKSFTFGDKRKPNVFGR